MLLAIDSGNTNVVFAVLDGQDVRAQWRLETNDRRTADEYFVWLRQLAEVKRIDLAALSGVIIANVRPATTFALERLAREHLGQTPFLVGKAGCRVDVTVAVDRPEQVGADRLVNAVAANRLYGSPAIVIDTGTATMFDVLDHRGAYVGGLIAPGVHVSAKALADAAAQLPLVPVDQPPSPIGRDTRHAMQSGLFWGYVAMLEGLLTRVKAAMVAEGHAAHGAPVRVIGTGGLMKILGPAMAGLDHLDPDLTLVGLRLIFDDNRARPA